MFRCVLCLNSSRNSSPIALTKKVSDRVTLEDCIRLNLPCANAILDDIEVNQQACTNCFEKFVNFYDFLKNIEENYNWNFVQVKSEDIAGCSFDNFVDITRIPSSSEQPLIVQNCSVRLERINPTSVKVEKIKEEKSDDEKIDESTRVDDYDDGSDFEWPQNDDENTNWSFPNESEAINEEVVTKRKYKKKRSETSEDEPTKKRSTYVRYLSRHLVTPEILATNGDYITIDGLEYKIPRRNRHKPIKEKNPKLKSLERTRRPHRAYDKEGEEKILNSVEVKCHECEDSPKFDSFFRVRKHFKRFHPDHPTKGYLMCCDKKFTRRYELLEHLEFHDKSVVHRCQLCSNGKDYKSSSSLRMHIKKYHENQKSIRSDRKFICQICGKSLTSAHSLRTHLDTHSSKSFECFICHKKKVRMISLKNHMRLFHEPPKMVTCTVCSKDVRDFLLKQHMNYRHSENSNKRTKCNFCDRWLLSQSMAAHVRHYHEDRGIECSICGKYLKRKNSIHSHMRQCHNEDAKKRSCSYCDKKFTSAVKLKEHEAVVHTREYPWACRVCGRQFRAAANWRMHEKKSHPDEYQKFFKPNYLKSNEELLAEQGQIIKEGVDYSVIEML